MITATDGRLPCADVTDAPARFKDLCLDARDPQALADWWCAALGYVRRDADRPASDPIAILDPTGAGPAMWFNQVPEPKTVKNRLHVDVDGDRDALLAGGATLLRAQDDDIRWDVLADPEGNEFCCFAPGVCPLPENADRGGPPKRTAPAGQCIGAGKQDSEVHAAHATVATGHGRSGLLRLLGDDGLGGEEERRDGRGVLQRRAGHLGRVDDSGGDHVHVLATGGVEAPAGLRVADLLHHDAALEAGVDGDLLQRGLERDAHDVGTGRLVTGQLELLERDRGRLREGHATTGDDALLDGGLGVAHRVLDAVLALLELDLGGRAGLDDGDAAGQLGEALLQLLAVVVGVRLLDLGADLVHPAGDLVGVTRTLDDRRLVLGGDELASAAEQRQVGVVELETDLLADDLATGQDRDVLQPGLAAGAEARGLDGDGLEGAPDLVHDQGRQGLALDALGDDRQRLATLHDLLQQREQVLDRADLGVDDQDVRVVEHRLHALGVGDEVRRQVTLVEAHALGELELEAEGVALLDGDDTFLADLVHRLGDELADGGVSGGDRRSGGDLLLGLDVLGGREQVLADGLDGLLDALLQGHRVGAGGDVAQTLAHERLGQNGGGGGAVTRDVVGLLRDLLDQLGPDLLPRVLELDLLGDAHTIVGDGGGAPLLLEDDVAASGTEGHLDGVGEGVHAPLEAAARLFLEGDHLGHVAMSSMH